jgi:hypothetical protein
MFSKTTNHDFVLGESWENPKGEICPTCKVNKLYTVECRNSLSRRDNKTYICNRCGTGEAMEDMK